MQTKCCTKCGEEKPLDAFHKDKHKKSGRVSHCKSCKKGKQNAYLKDYYQKNREAAIRYQKAYVEKNRNEIQKYQKKWRSDNSEHRSEYNKVYGKNHYQNNKPYYRFKQSNYRASKLKATPDWLNKAHHVEMEAMYLYNQIMPGDWHVDHIMPLQGEEVSGLHVPWNLQVITAEENLAKSNLLLDEAA